MVDIRDLLHVSALKGQINPWKHVINPHEVWFSTTFVSELTQEFKRLKDPRHTNSLELGQIFEAYDTTESRTLKRTT